MVEVSAEQEAKLREKLNTLRAKSTTRSNIESILITGGDMDIWKVRFW
jgi:hypothetical protein